MSIQRQRSAKYKCCKVSFVNDHCVEVFQYAAKHDYRTLMDEAGLVAIQDKYCARQIPFISCYRPDILSRQYSEHWSGLFDACYKEPPPILHRGGEKDCRYWRKFRNVVVSQVRHEVGIFSMFGSIVEGAKYHLKDCRHCNIRANNWVNRVPDIFIRNNPPRFTSFLPV